MAQSKTAGHITYSAVRGIKILKYILLRLFRGAVRLPEEIIDEMLKAFLHTRNAAIKVRAITKGYLVRRNPYDYMDDAAAKAFSYDPADPAADPGHILGRVGLKPSMYHRNSNMMMARWRYRADLAVQRALLQH